MHKDLLTINDLCRLLSIGKNTAYKLCKKKKIRSKRVGRRILIRQKDLGRYIEKKMDD